MLHFCEGRVNVASLTPYNILSICSGVGGLGLSLKIAMRNARTVCYVEREAQAAAVLAARMEDGSLHQAPVWSDLSTFDGKPWRGLVDCIISGDPCQPNSVAGARLGADDDRFLINQLIRTVEEVRPARVFRENVTGNADGQLAALVSALEAMGYSVAAGIFSASEVGASHRRERLFIMADAKSIKRRLGKSKGRVKETDIARRERELADTKSIFNGGMSKRNGEEHARPSLSRGNVADEPQTILPYFAPGPNDPRWGEIIRQAPSLKPALRTMADGVANRVDELRAAGNGVCPMAGAIAWLSLSAHFE